jgi:signal transduction histidine kinase/CheY-like chemotaxis protein
MLDTVETAIVFFTDQLECIDCNYSALEMFMFEEKDEYINGFYRSMPPFQANGMPSVQFFRILLLSAFKNGRANSEIMCQRTDGILIPADVILTCSKHEGELVVIAGFHNLTDIKHAMKKAVSASEIAQLYLSAAPLAMELFNDQYRIIDCNQQAIDLLGFSDKKSFMRRNAPNAANYLYHDIYTLKKDEDNFYKALSDGSTRYEWVFQGKDGTKIPCEITRIRITSPDRIFVVSYIHDLSTIKEMAAELKKAEVIERESRAKNQFLAQMSHVLRTPLNVITGLTGIQLQKANPPETEETFLQIQHQSERLLIIINDILDLSNADSGEMVVASMEIDIASLIIDIAQHVLIEKDLEKTTFNLMVDENLPCVLIGDDARLKQIIHIMLNNAFKFTPEGSVTLWFKSEKREQDHYLIIDVSDTGVGMSKNQVDNLFDSERSRYNEEGTIQGVGLGLVVLQRVVQIMSGTIVVESEKNKGSTFTVRLPIRAGSETVLGPETVEKLQDVETAWASLKKRSAIEYEPMPYGKVLVVDDVETNLYVAWGLMKPYGLSIDTAVGGFDALQKIKEGEKYDIIFMDHMMPDMDGIQTAKAIMATGCDFPIVALTANVIMGQAALFEENGFSGFLSKPIDMKQLDMYLMRFVRDKYPEEAKAAREAAPLNVAPVDLGVSDDLAKHFIRDAKNAAGVLEELMKKTEFTPDELKSYTITTHGMKSALANVDVTELSGVAKNLEDAGRHNDTEKIFAQTPLFIIRLKETIALFESTLKDDSENLGEDDPVFVKEQLLLLIEACDNYSKPTAKKVLAAMKEGQCSKETHALIDEISALLLHGEFEKTAEMAQKYMN